jgi:hypothetical protein
MIGLCRMTEPHILHPALARLMARCAVTPHARRPPTHLPPLPAVMMGPQNCPRYASFSIPIVDRSGMKMRFRIGRRCDRWVSNRDRNTLYPSRACVV